MSFTPFPILQTKRLLLRQVKITDSDSILFLRSDKVVNQYIRRATPKNLGDSMQFIQKISKKIANKELIYWGISLQNSTGLVGTICLWNFSADKKIGEVGYDLHPAFHQQGIMGEALSKVVTYGFVSLQLHSIEAFTHRANEASKKLLEKNGFQELIGRVDAANLDNIVFKRNIL